MKHTHIHKGEIMKQGVNNSRLYNKHRYRTFQDKHRGNISGLLQHTNTTHTQRI